MWGKGPFYNQVPRGETRPGLNPMKSKLESCLLFCATTFGTVLLFTAAAAAQSFSDDNWISMGGLMGANGPVSAIVADASGNLYIGGAFTEVGGTVATNVARWDGVNWSALGSGVND